VYKKETARKIQEKCNKSHNKIKEARAHTHTHTQKHKMQELTYEHMQNTHMNIEVHGQTPNNNKMSK
jgi:hypothetical protein